MSEHQRIAVAAVMDKTITRRSMAGLYAACIRAALRVESVDWIVLNAAIVSRWPKGLVWIKEQAWKKL